MKTINELADHVYLMNLEREFYKYEIAKKKLEEKGIEHQRFIGIDGYDGEISLKEKVKAFKNLTDAYEGSELWEPIVLNSFDNFQKGTGAFRSRGAMGCLLTIRNIIQDAVDNKYKKILIFQDDIYFHKDFDERMKKLTPVIESSVGVHLGASEYNYHMKNEKWNNPNWNVDKFRYSTTENTYGMWAIFIGQEMFAPFLELSKFNFFAADQCLAVLSYNMFFHSTWVAYPNLVIADLGKSNTFRDDVPYPRSMNPNENWARNLGWDLDFYDLSKKYYEENE
jgi:GR25 family glycosyltransferase involved in LPS biosynthesis